MYLDSEGFPNRYAKLVSWDDDDDAFNDMHTGRAMHPGHGIFVLEIQQRVYRFLVTCCKEILHDISHDQLISSVFPIQPKPSVPANNALGFTSLTVLTTEAPYRLPQDLDLLRIESMFSAKVSAAEDHIWALREDPGYFADSLLDFKEHRQEMMLDRAGSRHPVFQQRRQDIFWQRIIDNVIVNAYIGLELWHELLLQAQGLRRLQQTYVQDISPNKDLPTEYLAALLKFKHYLGQTTKGPLEQLKHCAVASPPLRPFFVRNVPVDGSLSKIQVCHLARESARYAALHDVSQAGDCSSCAWG